MAANPQQTYYVRDNVYYERRSLSGKYTLSRLFYSTCHNEKNTSRDVSFHNLFVTSIRSVDQPKTLQRLATKYAGVDKLPDYLRSDTKDVNQRQKNLFP